MRKQALEIQQVSETVQGFKMTHCYILAIETNNFIIKISIIFAPCNL